jgi:glycosyltransferase involved in cell wall biosynthesis
MSSYTDPRIRIIHNEKNIGLVNTLNKGLELANGEYIVRMDCDDMSSRNRLSVQVKFMDTHKNIGVSGSYYYLLLDGKKATADFPLSEKEMKCYMIFNCPIAHPTAIVRNSILRNENLRYRSEYAHSEDFDLWSRISEKYELANVSDILLNYRVHANQITGNVHLADQRYISVNGIRGRHLNRMGVFPLAEEVVIHNLVSDGKKADNKEELDRAEEWLKKLVSENDQHKKLDKHSFEKIILERWLRMCFNFYGGIKGLRYFYRSGLNGMIKLPLKSKLELINTLYNSWKRLKIK